jgi:predicted AlkP superfamily pyrophosphatase or phosphodiesterase
LADKLEEKKIPYHISNWRLTEKQNIDALINEIEKEEIRFSFLYTAAMDSLLHMVTKDGVEIPKKLDWYREQIQRVIVAAKKHYEKFNLYVMSDHGMTTLTEPVDVKKIIENMDFKFGKDYIGVYDSTLGRFWFKNDKARKAITEKLHEIPHAKLVTKEEKKKYGINFEDNMYGEEILLMDPGYQIEPCDLGLKALPAMHGFSPEHEDSYASFLATEPVDPAPKWVGDYHWIMVKKMDEILN